MSHLFRVLPRKTWDEAQDTGLVARCGNDNIRDCVHLNVREAVETIAGRYFTPDEDPIILEVDPMSFEDKIEWLEATEEDPWLQPRAKIPNLPVSSVVHLHEVKSEQVDGQWFYKMLSPK